MGSTINTMILGGLALAFSRVIDNSVISLENIYRHLEMGASPEAAAEQGGSEVSMAVLAATLTTVVVFFPVTFLYGVSKFLFSALALAVVLSLFASYFVAMTVIPLFCARFLKQSHQGHDGQHTGRGVQRLVQPEVPGLAQFLRTVCSRRSSFSRPHGRVFDRLVPGQPVACIPRWAWLSSRAPMQVNSPSTLKAPTGSRIEVTEAYVAKIEDLIRQVVDPADFNMVVSNIGIVPDFSALYSTNAGPYTATVQVELKESHKTSSFDYMDRVRSAIAAKYPELRTFFSSGSMVDAVLNSGMPAPIDVQVSSRNLDRDL